MTDETRRLLDKLDHNLNGVLFDLVDENETLEGQVNELREQVARLTEKQNHKTFDVKLGGELIYRQAVLDSLKEHRALYCDNTPETFSKLSYAEKSRVDELDTAIATIINLPSVENKGEWIPVKKCGYPKPEDEYKHFLTIDNKGEITIQEFLLSLDEEPQPYFTGMRNIVAWMPLPEPYKAEKGGE